MEQTTPSGLAADAIGAITMISKAAIEKISEISQAAGNSTPADSPWPAANAAMEAIHARSQQLATEGDASDQPEVIDLKPMEAALAAEAEAGSEETAAEAPQKLSPNDLVRAAMGGAPAPAPVETGVNAKFAAAATSGGTAESEATATDPAAGATGGDDTSTESA